MRSIAVAAGLVLIIGCSSTGGPGGPHSSLQVLVSAPAAPGDDPVEPAPAGRDYLFRVDRGPLLACLQAELLNLSPADRLEVSVNGEPAGRLTPVWPELSSRDYRARFVDRGPDYSWTLIFRARLPARLPIPPALLRPGENRLTIRVAAADPERAGEIAVRNVTLELRYPGPGYETAVPWPPAVPRPGAVKIEGRLRTARYGMPAVLIDEHIYVLGGSGTETRTLATVERYDTVGKSSEIIGDRLLPRRFHTAQAYRGRIYIMGGVTPCPDTGERRPTPIVERYDPVSGLIERLSPLNRPRRTPISVLDRGKIYLIGGSDERGRRLATVEIYDIESDTWSPGAPMPTARECDAVLYRGKIYAVGGYDGRQARKSFEVYDIAGDRWSRLPDLPFPLSAHHSAVHGDRLYTFGDYLHRSLVCS